MNETISLKSYIKQAMPFLEEAWKACFHGQKEALLSAEERGMGALLSQFRLIAEGEHPLPPGVITTKEAAKQTEAATQYWTNFLGNANEPVPWLKRWIEPGQTTVHALKKADERVTGLEIELEQAEAKLKRYDEVIPDWPSLGTDALKQAEAERDALEIKSKHVVSMINTIRQVMVKSLEHKDVFGGAVYLIDHTHMWALVGNAKELDSLLPASLKARIER